MWNAVAWAILLGGSSFMVGTILGMAIRKIQVKFLEDLVIKIAKRADDQEILIASLTDMYNNTHAKNSLVEKKA